MPAPSPTAPRGRAAASNPPVRFETQHTAWFDDGWSAEDAGAVAPVQTNLRRDASRSAISWNTSPDLGFDRSVNPYRGCEHGCIYCFARPTHAYLGLSPGLDFETELVFKPEVASLLERELRKPGYRVRPLALGTNTDPYQPVERGLRLTRGVLGVLQRFRHPLSIVTKSAGVLRDLDILAAMAQERLVRVHVSLTTLDAGLARRMEPRAATPARRLQTIAALAQAGVPVGVLAAPMIPGLNDAELEQILAAAANAGARHAGSLLLRLPLEVRPLFEDWLRQNYPARAAHVLSLIRQCRGGAMSDATFHRRHTGEGPYAVLLAQRFARAARQYGFGPAPALDASRFALPPPPPRAQLSLF
jgi:DNA repair photolyase